MSQKVIGDRSSLGAQPLDDLVKIDRVPMHDGSRNEAQARRPEALILEGWGSRPQLAKSDAKGIVRFQ